MHILVVDDEPGIRSVLRRGLEGEGFLVTEAPGKAAMFRCLEADHVSLITLDLDLGGEDGLHLAREIRSKRNLPIIMITGKSEPVDRVAGLEQGADDYITKPFHIKEVLHRVHAVLRRYELESLSREAQPRTPEPNERYTFEGGTLDASRRELRDGAGELVKLTDVEFDLLLIFLRRPQRVLTREEMMELLTGRAWSPLDRTVDGHVARLRRKIEPAGDMPRYIKSVRGVGYVLAAEVRQVQN